MLSKIRPAIQPCIKKKRMQRMGFTSIAVSLMRGGTSKGVFMMEHDLPPPGQKRDNILLKLIGSPDKSGMQLNGLGGGISSTSKIALMKNNSLRPGIVDYYFGQVNLTQPLVDWTGACGNLAAAAGIFVDEENLLSSFEKIQSTFSESHVVIPLWQKNANYLMHIHIPKQIPKSEWVSISGVPGTGPPIFVEILNPCEHQKQELLPSGNVVDTLILSNGTKIQATLLWAANPTIFIFAEDINLNGTELPSQLDFKNEIEPDVNTIMEQAAKLMGTQVSAAMRVCWVAKAKDYITTDKKIISASNIDILSRITTESRVHHAHTGTGALNLAISANIPGTIPFKALADLDAPKNMITIGHPGGLLEVSARVEFCKSTSQWYAEKAGMVRTARTLLKGIAKLQ